MPKNYGEKRLHFINCYDIKGDVINILLCLIFLFLFFIQIIEGHIWWILFSCVPSCDRNRLIIFLMVLGILVRPFLLFRCTIWINWHIISYYFINFSLSVTLDLAPRSCNTREQQCREKVIPWGKMFESTYGNLLLDHLGLLEHRSWSTRAFSIYSLFIIRN